VFCFVTSKGAFNVGELGHVMQTLGGAVRGVVGICLLPANDGWGLARGTKTSSKASIPLL
jgi:hypothetical protein